MTTSTIIFKACPRCGTGDVVVDRDMYGWNVQCLQCGYVKDFNSPREAVEFVVQSARKVAA